MKYRRLLKMVAKIGLFSAACGFVGKYFWDYGFSTEGMTAEILLARAASALGNGLYAGFWLGFPAWLALEKFIRPKNRTGVDTPLPRNS